MSNKSQRCQRHDNRTSALRCSISRSARRALSRRTISLISHARPQSPRSYLHLSRFVEFCRQVASAHSTAHLFLGRTCSSPSPTTSSPTTPDLLSIFVHDRLRRMDACRALRSPSRMQGDQGPGGSLSSIVLRVTVKFKDSEGDRQFSRERVSTSNDCVLRC